MASSWGQAAYDRSTGTERFVLILLFAAGFASLFLVGSIRWAVIFYGAFLVFLIYVGCRRDHPIDNKGNVKDESSNTVTFAALLSPLELAMPLAAPYLKKKVTSWDLDNPNLMLVLGYLFGFIDAAYQTTKPSPYDESMVEQIFDKRIAKHLSGIQGADRYLALVEASRGSGGSNIAGMQGNPYFMKGAMSGGNDLARSVNREGPPIGLATLLMDDKG
jgi:hypothetical protein